MKQKQKCQKILENGIMKQIPQAEKENATERKGWQKEKDRNRQKVIV